MEYKGYHFAELQEILNKTLEKINAEWFDLTGKEDSPVMMARARYLDDLANIAEKAQEALQQAQRCMEDLEKVGSLKIW